MTPQEAYEIVRKTANAFTSTNALTFKMSDVREALDVLSRHHVYFSRFKPGDTVWTLKVFGGRYEVAHGSIQMIATHEHKEYPEDEWIKVINQWRKSFDLFPTREEAEAEAARRNYEAAL